LHRTIKQNMEKFDYQIVTDTNNWIGGGVGATKEEIKKEVDNIKERLKEEGDETTEILVFKAPKMTLTTHSI
jgi:hypothetical protein